MSNVGYLILTTIHIFIWIIICIKKQNKIDILEPFYIISGLYWMIFVYAPMVWISRGQTSYQSVEVMEYLPRATLVFNLGYFIFCIAYLSRIHIRIFYNKYQCNTQDYYSDSKVCSFIVKYGWCVFGVSMALVLLYYSLTGRGLVYMLTMGQGEQLKEGREGLGIYFLAQFARSAIPGLMLVFAFSKKKNIWMYLCAYLICSVCISSGSRNLAICVVLSMVSYNYLQKGKRPSIFYAILAVALLYFFVGFIGIFRGDIKSGGSFDLSRITPDAIFDAFMFNVEIFYPFYNLIEYIPKNSPFHYGLGIVNVFIQFVPRIIWPSKPATIGKTAFEVMYGDSMGGAAYPNIGEFYYELGIPGVIVLMYVFGRVMHNSYQTILKSKNKVDMVTYAITFGYLMQFICRGHFASWALDIVFMFGPLWFLKWLAKRNMIIRL